MSLTGEALEEFLGDPLVPAGTKIEDYLTVLLGLRDASMMWFPHDLPDASILGATIRNRFHEKVSGKWIPGNPIADYLVRRMRKSFPCSDKEWSRYTTRVLSDSCREVLSASSSCHRFLAWSSRLRLGSACVQAEPSVIAVFLCRTEDVASRVVRLFGGRELRCIANFPGRIVAASRSPEAVRGEHGADLTRTIGQLLGYPSCCIQRYILDRERGHLEPVKRGARQLMELDSGEGADVFAYFVRGFVPCAPRCERASAVGRRIYGEIERLDPALARAYENRLRENLTQVLQGEQKESPGPEEAETVRDLPLEPRDFAPGYRNSDGTGEA